MYYAEYGRDAPIDTIENVVIGDPATFGKRYSDLSGKRAMAVSDDGAWVQVKNAPLDLNGPCFIEVRDFQRDSNGLVSSYVATAADRSEIITCTGTNDWWPPWTSNYTWRLERSPMIDQVQHHGWGEQVEHTQNGYTLPYFNSTDERHASQQWAFYSLNQMRFFTTQNMYSQESLYRRRQVVNSLAIIRTRRSLRFMIPPTMLTRSYRQLPMNTDTMRTGDTHLKGTHVWLVSMNNAGRRNVSQML